MNILAIDTGGASCSVALLGDGTVYGGVESDPSQQSRNLVSLIDQVFSDSGLRPGNLDLLAWNAGPASFTGLRVGASVVQAMAYAFGTPVLPVSALALQASALAEAGLLVHGDVMAVAMDARMNGIYWAIFAWQDGLCRLSEDQLLACSPDAIRDAMAGYPGVTVAAGDGWTLLSERGCPMHGMRQQVLLPDANTVLQLALHQPGTLWQTDPAQVLPAYIGGVSHWKKRFKPVLASE